MGQIAKLYLPPAVFARTQKGGLRCWLKNVMSILGYFKIGLLIKTKNPTKTAQVRKLIPTQLFSIVIFKVRLDKVRLD